MVSCGNTKCYNFSRFTIGVREPVDLRGGGGGGGGALTFLPEKYTQCPNERVLKSECISIGNRMNASAFRDIWARVMFFKFSKLHEPQASAI